VKASSFFAALLVLAFPGLRLAAGHVRDLGEALAYIRAGQVPDKPDALPLAPAAVLDLRYAAGDDAAAARLRDWLQTGAAERRLLLVLANPETAAPLRHVLAPSKLPARVLVIGRAGEDFTPDIPVAFGAEEEHAAWTAADNEDFILLLADNPGKIRQDEAAVVRRHQNGGGARAGREAVPPTAASLPPDRVLQRAVQLHRGLSALQTGGK
jgi:hypothetical protein